MNCSDKPINDFNPLSPLMGEQALAYVESYMGFSLSSLLSFPKFIMLEPINRCNAKCVMCGIDFTARKKAVMSQQIFKKITMEMAEHRDHIEKILIALDGEPLLDRTLHKRIRELKDAGLKLVNVTTNASLLTQKRSVELIEAGLDEIYITIDSLKKPVYEAIRDGLDFDEVYNNTCNFVELRNRLNPKLTIRIAMILQEQNFHEAESFENHWRGILGSSDQIVVQKAHNWANTVDVVQFGGEETINNIPCISLWGTMTIHADGVVGLCCMDTKCAYPTGDLNHNSMAEIWHSEAFERARELHLSGRRREMSICDGCTVWRPDKHQLLLNDSTAK
jgi:hypothetical protein